MASSIPLRLLVRVRPFLLHEDIDQSAITPIDGTDPTEGVVIKSATESLELRCESVMWSLTDASMTGNLRETMGATAIVRQTDVYSRVAHNYLSWAMQGINCSIVVAGNKKSGKLFTAVGEASQPGLAMRLMQEFCVLAQDPSTPSAAAEVTMYEVDPATNTILDVLAQRPDPHARLQHNDTVGVFTTGVSSVFLSSYHSVGPQVVQGVAQKRVASLLVFAMRIVSQHGTGFRSATITIVTTPTAILQEYLSAPVPVRPNVNDPVNATLHSVLRGNCQSCLVATLSPDCAAAGDTIATAVACSQASSHANDVLAIDFDPDSLLEKLASTSASVSATKHAEALKELCRRVIPKIRTPSSRRGFHAALRREMNRSIDADYSGQNSPASLSPRGGPPSTLQRAQSAFVLRNTPSSGSVSPPAAQPPRGSHTTTTTTSTGSTSSHHVQATRSTTVVQKTIRTTTSSSSPRGTSQSSSRQLSVEVDTGSDQRLADAEAAKDAAVATAQRLQDRVAVLEQQVESAAREIGENQATIATLRKELAAATASAATSATPQAAALDGDDAVMAAREEMANLKRQLSESEQQRRLAQQKKDAVQEAYDHHMKDCGAEREGIQAQLELMRMRVVELEAVHKARDRVETASNAPSSRVSAAKPASPMRGKSPAQRPLSPAQRPLSPAQRPLTPLRSPRVVPPVVRTTTLPRAASAGSARPRSESPVPTKPARPCAKVAVPSTSANIMKAPKLSAGEAMAATRQSLHFMDGTVNSNIRGAKPTPSQRRSATPPHLRTSIPAGAPTVTPTPSTSRFGAAPMPRDKSPTRRPPQVSPVRQSSPFATSKFPSTFKPTRMIRHQPWETAQEVVEREKKGGQ